MRAPLAESLDGLDIGLVGVPFDLGVTHRAGARHGPREIRNQSTMMRNIHHVTRVNPYERCRIADLGDVRFSDVYHLDRAIQEIEDFYRAIHQAGVTPLTAGGDHSITFPILKALSADGPLGLVHIDAHLDTWPAFMGSPLHHGAPFRQAVESGAIDPKRTIQIGIRGAQNISDGWDYSRDAGMRVVFMEELLELGVKGVLSEVRRIVGEQPAYVSFDIDSMDPAFAPGTGTPEVGGLSTREAQALLRGLASLNTRWRGRRRGSAAVRPERRHGPGRRHDDVRAALRPCGRAGALSTTSREAGAGTRLRASPTHTERSATSRRSGDASNPHCHRASSALAACNGMLDGTVLPSTSSPS